MLNIDKILCMEVIWYNYIKPMQILKKYINRFFYLIRILIEEPNNYVLQKLRVQKWDKKYMHMTL